MSVVFSLSDLRGQWDVFLRSHYAGEIERMANEYPDRRSLWVSYLAIATNDHALASDLLDHPERSLHQARLALRANLPPDTRIHANVRISGLPVRTRAEIRYLRAIDVGRFVAIEGMVRKVSEVYPRLLEGAFKCIRCGHITLVPQTAKDQTKPLECNKDNAGCGKTHASTRWDLVTELSADTIAGDISALPVSTFVDIQRIELQENPEGLAGGEQAQRLELTLHDDLAGIANPGTRVIVNGILKTRAKGSDRAPSSDFEIYLQVNSIDMIGEDFAELAISPEDEEQIRALAASPNIYADAIASIAPNLYGLSTEKEAVLLQLYGGVPKVFPDGSRLRGDIHILLVGDPGVAKSELLQVASKLSPRGIYTSGKGTSGVGLTAATIQDKDRSGGWVVEAGALVLGDKGMVCIDELAKMSNADRENLHTAMEQQIVAINKANIHTTLNSRTSVLAACNPKFGRFDDRQTLPEQLDLDPPLLSRFDAIFAIYDTPEQIRDERTASFVVKRHAAGERIANDHSSPIGLGSSPPIPRELLRKAIAYARRTCNPLMGDGVVAKITDYYVTMRASARDGAIPLTVRQVEALVRLSEASARVRLSSAVAISDVDRAIRIIDHFLRRFASQGGSVDMAIISSGHSVADHDRRRNLLRIIEELQGSGGAEHIDVLTRAAELGMDAAKIDTLLAHLLRDGSLYTPSTGRWRVP